MTTFWYLASPYSKYGEGLEAAFQAAACAAALLVRHRVPVFSPIAHTHPIAMAGRIDPLDHQIWLPADAPVMAAASGMILLMLPGWQDSYGMKVEEAAFRAAGKPVVPMVPGHVPETLLHG